MEIYIYTRYRVIKIPFSSDKRSPSSRSQTGSRDAGSKA